MLLSALSSGISLDPFGCVSGGRNCRFIENHLHPDITLILIYTEAIDFNFSIFIF